MIEFADSDGKEEQGGLEAGRRGARDQPGELPAARITVRLWQV
jgi:hypothetical protein